MLIFEKFNLLFLFLVVVFSGGDLDTGRFFCDFLITSVLVSAKIFKWFSIILNILPALALDLSCRGLVRGLSYAAALAY